MKVLRVLKVVGVVLLVAALPITWGAVAFPIVIVWAYGPWALIPAVLYTLYVGFAVAGYVRGRDWRTEKYFRP